MTWPALLAILEAEAGAEARARIEARILSQLRGERLHIPKRAPLTLEQIRAALARHNWRVSAAAAELRIHPATIYRRLRRTNRPHQPAVEPPQSL